MVSVVTIDACRRIYWLRLIDLVQRSAAIWHCMLHLSRSLTTGYQESGTGTACEKLEVFCHHPWEWSMCQLCGEESIVIKWQKAVLLLKNDLLHNIKTKRLKVVYSTSRKRISELRRIITCHTGSHIVTCHLQQVSEPHPNHTQAGGYSIYLLWKKMKSWVNLGGWLYSEMIYLFTDSH